MDKGSASPENITIVGAGFSGLTLAYYLVKQGYRVKILSTGNPGGLIQTVHLPEMEVETAANGFLWTPDLQNICDDIGIDLYGTLPGAKKRFIWRDGLKQWPVGFSSSLKIGIFLIKFIFARNSVSPKSGETVSQWCNRVLNSEILTWLVAPALKGIYAGDENTLSASLILNSIFNRSKRSDRAIASRKMKGTVAPLNGMSDFFNKLKEYLIANGVYFESKQVSSSDIEDGLSAGKKIAIAVEPWAAAELIEKIEPSISKGLKSLTILSVAKVTVAFKEPKATIKGFGVLFPASAGCKSLGVLSNTYIFPNRGKSYNESWIMGGALSPEITSKSDDEILSLVKIDREKILRQADAISSFHITKWPKAFVHYDVTLENILPFVPQNKNLYFTGNYLGVIGLSRILNYNKNLAKEMA